MSDDILGAGWSFPLALHDAQVLMAGQEESVRQAIWLILATAPGERVMRPDFGCGLHELVFALDSADTLAHAAELVRDALTRWEPRIDLLDVAASTDEAEPALLLIEIDYRVRSTNNRFNLVYPFYLE